MSESDSDTLESLHDLLDNKQLPPVHLWHPDTTRNIDIRIARNGDWFYQGSHIQRERMVKLFSTVLRCDDDGHTYLVTPQERLRIEVEDAPFTAVLLEQHGEGAEQSLIFTTNVGDRVLAGENNLITVEYRGDSGEPSPYIVVRDNLRALISRSVFIELAQLAQSLPSAAENEVGVYSNGLFMQLAMQ